MQSMKLPFLSSLGARRTKHGIGRRATWLMVTLATLFAVLAVAVPTPRPASAADPTIEVEVIDLVVPEKGDFKALCEAFDETTYDTTETVEYETACLKITATGVNETNFPGLDWVIVIDHETNSNDPQDPPSKYGGPGHHNPEGQERYWFTSYEHDATAETVTAMVKLDRLVPASDYTVDIEIADKDGDSEDDKAKVSTTFSTKSGCVVDPKWDINKKWFKARAGWVVETSITRTSMTAQATVLHDLAPLNSGRCMYYTMSGNGESIEGSAYVYYRGSGGRNAWVFATGLAPGKYYYFSFTPDRDHGGFTGGFGDFTLGPKLIVEVEDVEQTTATVNVALPPGELEEIGEQTIHIRYYKAADEYKLNRPEEEPTPEKTENGSRSFDLTGLSSGTEYKVGASMISGFPTHQTESAPFTTKLGLPPGKPTDLEVEPGDRQLEVSWDTPATGGVVDDYIVQWKSGIETFVDAETDGREQTVAHISGTTTYDTTISGLTYNTEYTLRVLAVNESGSTSSDEVVQATLPDAPSGLNITPGIQQLSLSWDWDVSTQTGDVTITHFEVEYKKKSETSWSSPTTVTSSTGTTTYETTITGRDHSTEYDVRVRADNGVALQDEGDYNWEASTGTTLPDKPTSLAVESGNQQLTLSWKKPLELGSVGITDYVVQYRKTSETSWFTSSATNQESTDSQTRVITYSNIITGLDYSTDYDLRVRADNEVTLENEEDYNWADEIDGQTIPNSPGMLDVVPGNEKLTLSWKAPADSGSITITGFIVQYKKPADSGWNSHTPLSASTLVTTIGSLDNGNLYIVRVRAINKAELDDEDDYNWARDEDTPRPSPSIETVTVDANSVTQTEATVTVTLDRTNGVTQRVYLQYRTVPAGEWITPPKPDEDTDAISVDIVLDTFEGNTEYEVQAWLGIDVNTKVKSEPFTTKPVPPGAPTNTAVTPGNTIIELGWDPPLSADNGGASVTHYVIEWVEYLGHNWETSTLQSDTPTDEEYKITGLTNGTRYAVRLRADNLEPLPAGKSYSWVFIDATPRTIPAAPIVEVTPDNARLHVSWNKPDNGGEEITGFVVQYKKNADSAWITHAANAGSNTLKTTIPDLDNGELYDVQVRAFNSATVPNEPDYNWGKDDGMPRTIPAEPALTVTAGNAVLEVSWDEPDDGGDTITGHIVQYKKNTDVTWDTSIATIDENTDALTEITSYKTTISTLENGTLYDVRVRSVNSVVLDDEENYNWGEGSGKPITIPGLPTVSVTPGNAQLEVNWNKPDAGGDTITGFVVQYMKDTDTGWMDHSTPGPNDTATTISSLDNGDLYTVRVRAVNSVVLDDEENYNWGDDSGTPRTIPNKPTSVDVTHGDKMLTVTWKEPDGTLPNDGGDTITEYEIQWKEKNTSGWSSPSEGRVSASAPLELAIDEHLSQPLTNGVRYEVRVRAVNAAQLDPGQIYNWEYGEETPSTTPGAPLKVRMSNQGDKELKVEWDAPDVTGGDNISGYVVQWRVKGISNWASTSTTEDDTIAADKFSHTFTQHLSADLANGVRYEARVLAKNRNGRGTPSPHVKGMPRTTPDFPTDLNVMEGIAELVLTWTAPDETGGINITIDYYIVEYMKEGESSFTPEQTGDAREGWTLDELENGKLYTIQVKAHNSEGDTSEPSGTATGKPRTIPGKPDITAVTAGNGTLTVTWTGPTDDGGDKPSKYILEWVEWVEASSTWQASGSKDDNNGSPSEIGSLANGTLYRVVVKAHNAAGTGPASDPEEGTPKTIPDAPTVELTPGDEELKVVWNKPDNGGDTITGFKVQYKKDTDEKWTELSEFGAAVLETTITGLDNGDPYTVWVRAVNTAKPDAGEYNWGKKSDTPRTFPAAPSVSLEHGDNQLKVIWDKPDKRGATITGFVVQYKKAADAAWIGHSTPGPEDTTTDITGLDNGVLYDVRVRAVNSVTLDDEDNYEWGKKSKIPRTIPGPVTELGIISGDEELTVSWVAPTADNNGGAAVKRYVLQWKSGNEEYDPDSNRHTETTDVSKVLKELSNGILYSIRVRADNDETADNYNWVQEEGTPMSVPGAPTGLGVEEGDEQLVVSWVVPEETGGVDVEIEHYVIQWKLKTDSNWDPQDTHETRDETVLRDTITDLDNGEMYDIRVAAANSMSESDNYIWANTSGKPRTIPGPPRSLSVTAGDGQLTLSWVAPSDDGGLTINRYVVQWKSDSDSQQYNNIVRQGTTSSLSYTIRGLTNDDLHSVRVRADNTVILPDEESYNWAPETGTPVATPNPPPPPPQNNNPPPQRSPPPPNNPPPQNTPEVLTPNISSVRADNITKTTARAVVNIDHHDGTELTVELRYQLKADVQDWTTGAKTAEATSSASPATKNLESLTPGTEYVLQASFDEIFPDDATQEYTFRTERQPSIQSVSVSNIGRTSARATINIANSDGSTQTAKLQYRTTSPQGQWSTPPLEGTSPDATAVIDLGSLTADTDYEVQAWLATDETDKKTATFRTSQAQQQRSPVVQKPSISSVTFINIMQTSAVTNVSIRNAGTAQKTVRLHYRADGTTAWSTPPKSSTTKSSGTTIALTDLTAGTTYEVQVWLNTSLPAPGTKIYEFTTLDEMVVANPVISSLQCENIGQTSATAIVVIADAGTGMKEVFLKHSMDGTDEWTQLPFTTITYADSTSINLTGLQVGTTYQVAVALSEDFSGMVIEPCTTLPLDPVVSGISVDRRKQTSVWANVSIANANGEDQTVHLRYRTTTPRGDWVDDLKTTSDSETASKEIDDLTADTEYEVQASLDSTFPDELTKNATFTTLRFPSISNLEVEDETKNSATAVITLADPDGTSQTMHLRYRTTTPQGEWSDIAETTTSTDTASKEITGLTADTEYEVQASLDSTFPDELTKNATFTTLRFPSISNLEVEDETKNSATAVITLADPDGTSQTIHLRYRTTTPQRAWSSMLETISTTSEASIALTGLAPDTEYETEVSLTSDFAVSETDTFRTLPPDPVVSGISVDRRKQTSVWTNISIANANDEDQTVHLRYRTTTPRGDWIDDLETTSDSETASKEISGLRAGTEYDVQASLDDSFPSSRTKLATFTTLRWPSIASFEAENIGRNGATVSATIADSRGVAQTVYVRHRATGYIAWRPTQQMDSVDDIASLRLRGLSSGTEYIAEASLDSSFPDGGTRSVTFTTKERDDDDDGSSSGGGNVAQAAHAANVPLLGFSPQMLRFVAIEGGDNPAPQAFSVWNRAQGSMSFNLSNHEEWLSQQPMSGVSNGPDDPVIITASVDSSELASGQYVDVVNIDVTSSGKSPGQVIVVLDVLPPDYIRQFVSRDEGGVVVLPDGTVKIIVQPESPPKDVDIELMKVNLQAHGQPPGEQERVVVAIESNTYEPGGDTSEDVAYAPYVELWVQLPQEDAAACDESRARVYSVQSGVWSLVEHRCEMGESDKVWAVAEVERLGAFALVIDDAPVLPTPTPVAAALATPTNSVIKAAAPAIIRISLPAQPPTPVPTSVPKAVPVPNGKTTIAPMMMPMPTPTAVPAVNEPSAPTMQAAAGDGGSGGFGKIILAALGVPMLIGALIVVYLLYKERRRRDDARMI